MLLDICRFSVLVLALSTTVHGRFSEEEKALMNQVHTQCLSESGVNEDIVNKAMSGDFVEDDKFMCFIKCIWSTLTVMDDEGAFDVGVLEVMLPPDMKDVVMNAMRACAGEEMANIQHGNNTSSIIVKKMTPEYLNEALNTLSLGFFPYENVCLGCSLVSNPKACKELENLAALTFEDNVSFIAIDSTTNKVIGALFNKIQKSSTSEGQSFFENFRDHHCNESNSKSLINCMIEMDSFIDIFSKFNVNQVLELMFITVNPDFRRKGVGFSLIKTCLEVIQEEKPEIKLFTILATSKFTYNIVEKLKFENVLRKEFSDFSFNNESYETKVDCKVHNKGLVLLVKQI